MKKSLILAASMLSLASVYGADPVVKNGSFEDLSENKAVSWNVNFTKGVDAKVTTETIAIDGMNALKIVNNTARAPHVFAEIHQTIQLIKGNNYVLNFKAKGESAKGICFCLGKTWGTRFYFAEKLKPEWQEFSFKFTAKPEDFDADGTSYGIRIISEDITKEAFIDSITIRDAE